MATLQSQTPKVLLAGNPNAGKTTLFNALSGARHKVGNYPGVTIDRASAKMSLPGGNQVELVDVPGTYSISARSPEEQVAVDTVLGSETDAAAVLCVVDASSLARSLYLPLQFMEAGLPVVIAVNMMDLARKDGDEINLRTLSDSFGVPVIGVTATKREGFGDLLSALATTVASALPAHAFDVSYSADVEEAVQRLQPSMRSWLGASVSKSLVRARSLWALLCVGDDELFGIPDDVRQAVLSIPEAKRSQIDEAVVSKRYRLIDRICHDAKRTSISDDKAWTERIDGVLTHRVWGLVVFAFVMFAVFEALFSWSEPLIAVIESGVARSQTLAQALLPAGALQDLLVNGVIAGVGNVLVFVPQILMLFVFIAFLEDTGYLARVAFVIDKLMSSVGLHGKAFVPLLSGFACAVPAVMATRTIENRRDRLVVMLSLPLMTCSARLPVYVLIIATVFAGSERVLGVFSVGAAVLFSMYLLSVFATLGAAAVFRRTAFKGPTTPLILELPRYRWPTLLNLWLTTWRRLKSFLVDAGTIILALTIVLWALLSYPKNDDAELVFETQRSAAVQIVDLEEREAALSTIDSQQASERLRYSVAGRAGQAIEPVIRPLGFDWRVGVGIIGAFAAREVFISTLGMVFGIEDAKGDEQSLRSALQSATHSDGAKLMTPLAGASLMIFFLFACQCMSTIAVVRRESGSWKWPIVMFVYMTVLAYVASLAVYQIGKWLGWGLS